jgi:hypothetical protein
MTQNMTKNIIDTLKSDLNTNNNDLIKLVFAKNSLFSKDNNFITNIDIFNNIKDMIQNIESKLKENNIKYIITNQTFIRDQYYSQICDRLSKTDIIYTENLTFIDKISDKNIDIFILNSDKIEQHRLSFPNLYQYHHSTKINATYIDIENIKIIFENDNMFIEINKDNKRELNYHIFELIFDLIIK